MGLRDIAVVYLDNAYGKEVLGYANEAFKEQQIKSIGNFALDVGGKDAETVVQKAIDSNAGAVFLATTGTANTAFMMPFRKAKPGLPVAGVSVAVVTSEMNKLGDYQTAFEYTTKAPAEWQQMIQANRSTQVCSPDRSIGWPWTSMPRLSATAPWKSLRCVRSSLPWSTPMICAGHTAAVQSTKMPTNYSRVNRNVRAGWTPPRS